MTRETDPTSLERTVLPPPDPAFNGRIEVAFKDSRSRLPRAFEGAGRRAERVAGHG